MGSPALTTPTELQGHPDRHDPARHGGDVHRHDQPRLRPYAAAAPQRDAEQALAQPWATTARRTTRAGTTTWPGSSRCPPAPSAIQRGVPRSRPRARGRRGQGQPRRLHREPVGALGLGRRGQGPELAVRRPTTRSGRATPTRSAPRSTRWATSLRPSASSTGCSRTQQKKDGSFPQNSDVDGKEEWTEIQLDQVTLPIALAHLVGKTDAKTYKGIKKAVRFLLRFRDEETGLKAPFSPQERWENQSGYSPATIAAEIDGLVTGAAIARQRGDVKHAEKWEKVADRWAAQGQGLDRHEQRPAQRRAVLPPRHQGRQAQQGHDLRDR